MTIAEMWFTSSWVLVSGTTVFTHKLIDLQSKKMTLFTFTLAVTKNFSAPLCHSIFQVVTGS